MIADPRLGPAAHPRTARMPLKMGATMTVSSEAFLSQLTAVAADIESLIDRLLAAPAIEGERARPRRLLDAMRYASLNGGKRFRPFLVVATAALFDVPRQPALMVGAPQSNDVVLDARGLIYVVDRHVGFDVLEFDGGR
jgi:hypothetical protein